MLVPTGGRKPTETSVTMFATKARIFSKQKREFISPGAKKIKIILFLIQGLFICPPLLSTEASFCGALTVQALAVRSLGKGNNGSARGTMGRWDFPSSFAHLHILTFLPHPLKRLYGEERTPDQVHEYRKSSTYFDTP